MLGSKDTFLAGLAGVDEVEIFLSLDGKTRTGFSIPVCKAGRHLGGWIPLISFPYPGSARTCKGKENLSKCMNFV